jgi:hypothetical protein
MVDFAELRNQILFGEGDTSPREQSSIEKEVMTPSTGVPLFLGAATLAFCIADKAKFDVLGSHRTITCIALGVAPLAYGLGRVSRGVSAQDEIKRYESLLEATQNAYENEREDDDEVEQNAEQVEQMAYLADDAQYLFEPMASADHVDFGSHGIYGAAVGQESFGFAPTADLFAPRVSYESQTFGW